MVYPIFTPLILKTNLVVEASGFGARGLLLALLICAFPLGQLFGAPFFGRLADKRGRRHAFTYTLLGEFVGFIATAIAVHHLLYVFLLLARLWTGFFAGNLTVGMAAMSDMSQDRAAKAKNFGLVASVTGLGFVIAVLLGGVLSNEVLNHVFKPSLPFYLAALLCLLNLWLIRKGFYDQPFGETCQKCALSLSIKWLYLVYFLFMLGWISMLQYLSAFSIERLHVAKTGITWTFLVIGIVWLIGNSGLNRLLVTRFSSKLIAILSLILLASSILAAALCTHVTYFRIFAGSAALFASFVWVNLMSMISSTARPENQGRAMGYSQSVAMIAMMAGSLLGGSLAALGTQTIYFTSTACILLSFIAGTIIMTRDKDREKEV